MYDKKQAFNVDDIVNAALILTHENRDKKRTHFHNEQ